MAAFSLFQLWGDSAMETRPADTIIKKAHVIKAPGFGGAFPNVGTVEKLDRFADLSASVQLHNLPVPRNLNILFMGDSMARYQYLDLVYFLSHNGTWPSPDERPNLVMEYTHTQMAGFNFSILPIRRYDRMNSAIVFASTRRSNPSKIGTFMIQNATIPSRSCESLERMRSKVRSRSQTYIRNMNWRNLHQRLFTTAQTGSTPFVNLSVTCHPSRLSLFSMLVSGPITT